MKHKYIKVLKIEMEDLNEDINMYREKITKDKNCGEITNYVFMENLALLQNEIIGIETVNKYLDSLDVNEFETIEDIITKIKTDLEKKLREDGIAQALYIYLERKIDKVRTYVLETK